jgi:hypothetical protein
MKQVRQIPLHHAVVERLVLVFAPLPESAARRMVGVVLLRSTAFAETCVQGQAQVFEDQHETD